MPVPFEAIIPFGIIAGLMSVTGYGLMVSHRLGNEGKPRRHGITDWDVQMMERDMRLTGTRRDQSDNPVAPTEFKTNTKHM
ncbi:hypothetical protein IWQ61_009969 [Dispira simplex]|nr:hypothetical protein IWQ61_009969 [Dispira simplex]